MFLLNKYIQNFFFSTGLFDDLSALLHQVTEGATLQELCSLSLAPNEVAEEMKSKHYLKVYQMQPPMCLRSYQSTTPVNLSFCH